MSKEHKKRLIIFAVIIPLLLEVFLFNFRFWESLFWNRCDSIQQTYDDGILTIDNINSRVFNIYITTESYSDIVPVRIYMSDDANTEFGYSITEVDNAVYESRFIRVHPDGNVKRIRIDFKPYGEAQTFPAPASASVSLNAVRPFIFRIMRFFAVLIITLLIVCFRPGSKIYKISLFGDNGRLNSNNRLIIIFAAVLLITLWAAVLMQYQDVPINEYYIRNHVEAIYSFQAEALLDGHTNLNIDPPDYMAELVNPYDPYLRNQASEISGISSRGDFAYYNGKYYSYYGIVPTVIFYVPGLMITGEALSNLLPVIVMSIILIIAIIRIILILASRFKNLTLGHYLLITSGVLFASFAIYCVQTPWIYSVAFISGLAFASSAVAFWLHAAMIMGHSTKPDKDIKVILLLIAGSVMMSLAFGSRPSFILYVLLAFPIFGEQIKKRHFFSAKGMLNTIAVILPSLLLCSTVLFYNYIRFDSILDFGAKRNLSVDVMYHEASPATLITGAAQYLFQLPNLNSTFPFIHSVYDWNHNTVDYQGVLFFDPVFGGIFTLAPFTIFALLFFKRRKSLKSYNFYGFVISSILIGIILMCVDIQMGGISMRYQIDFALLFALASAVVVMDYLSEGKTRTMHYYLIAFSALTVVMLMMTSMALEKPNPMITYSTDLYYSLKYLFFVLR